MEHVEKHVKTPSVHRHDDPELLRLWQAVDNLDNELLGLRKIIAQILARIREFEDAASAFQSNGS